MYLIIMQQRPSAKKEDQIADWILKETGAGIILRNDLIYWFIQHLLRQNTGVEVTLGPDFVDHFLSRHPQLVKNLAIPPLPATINLRPNVLIG